MKYIDLLGVDIKSEFICDLYETYDVNVIYEYDRTHEGRPDRYIAEIPELGLNFVFDETRTCKTLFIKPVDIKTYNPFEEKFGGITIFDSKAEAIKYAKTFSVKTTVGNAVFIGEKKIGFV